MTVPKFRVWHHELQRMMTIKAIWYSDNEIEELELNDAVMNDCITAYPDEITFMQSTGLKDKHGIAVYLGDIVKCTRGCPHEVVFLQEYAGTYVGGMPAIYLSGLQEGYAWTGYEEIIGNIYEHKHLLEEE